MRSNRISRVVRILTALQSGERLTADDLAKMFNTSRRTIFRDLKELQSIGVPYEFDQKEKNYKIDPEFFLPPIDLNLQQALSLLLLVHKASKQMQMPFMNSALMAALKIESNLPKNIKKYCYISLKSISVMLASKAPGESLDNIFCLLQKAIEKKSLVKINYNSLYDRKVIDTELSPFHLLYNNRAWYIIGFSSVHNNIRTFKLNRIRDAVVLNKRYIAEQPFDLEEYLGCAWSMIPEGKIYDIKLKFLPKVAHNVSEVHWHNTQKVYHKNDGSAIIEFRVDGLGEITWWILGYGDQVEVLEPKELRKKIRDIGANIQKFNQ